MTSGPTHANAATLFFGIYIKRPNMTFLARFLTFHKNQYKKVNKKWQYLMENHLIQDAYNVALRLTYQQQYLEILCNSKVYYFFGMYIAMYCSLIHNDIQKCSQQIDNYCIDNKLHMVRKLLLFIIMQKHIFFLSKLRNYVASLFKTLLMYVCFGCFL